MADSEVQKYLYEDYQTVPELRSRLKRYFKFYNQEHLHQSLYYITPTEIHFS